MESPEQPNNWQCARQCGWQRELSQSVTRLAELCRLLQLPDPPAETTVDFPLLVPRRFVERMARRDPNDPLLLQVLPRPEETQPAPGFSCDPLGEFGSLDGGMQKNRVLKKYPGRALVLVTQRCGIHCRFCFRRHLPKHGSHHNLGHSTLDGENLDEILTPLRNDDTVEEVILSGGDPLLLDDEKLDRLLHCIEKIPHVKRIRVHSRLPVVLPSRITDELAGVLSRTKPVYLVLHVNHPNEIGEEFRARRPLLRDPVLLSQTVLLKGINDNADTLAPLFTALIDLKIVPYYLHQLDKVQGAAHFEVSEERGLQLIAELRHRLPGYAVPTYVREWPGEPGKQAIEGAKTE